MAKNRGKVSVNAFDKVAGEQAVSDAVLDWHGVEITIKHTLGLTEMMEFVHDAAESCFSESGVFVPEVMDFAIKSNLLSRYGGFSLPDNLEHRYALIYGTDAVDVVSERIDRRQFEEMTAAIRSRVAYACESKAALIQQKMDALLVSLEALMKQSEAMFAGVSREDLHKLLAAMANGGFDEESLVRAYLAQTKPPAGQKDGGTE